MPRKKPTAPEFPGALNPELEAAIDAAYDAAWEDGYQSPPQTGAHAVYADWLQEKAHPLGEQLALELADDDTWKKKTKKKSAKLDRAAAIAAGRAANPTLYGADLPIGEDYGAAIRVTWQFGFIASIEIKTENKKAIAKCLEALVRLPTARFVRSIEVGNAASADAAQLAAFPSLRELTFHRGTPDLSSFAGGSVRLLSLPLLDANAARGIESLPALSELRVRDCTLEKPLAAKGLRSLRIGDNARSLRSLSFVAKLASLESLSIDGSGVRSLAPLAGLTSLKFLTVSSAKALSSLEGVEKLAQLESLDVNLTAVASLEPLGKCRALRTVNLRGTKIKDLSPLWKLPELETIRAEKTKVKSLAGIGKLGKLTTLWIFDTPLRDLAPLADLASLEVLNIAGLTKAGPLDVLAKLPKLRSLDVMSMKPPFDPEIVAQAPALDDVRGCDWPPASRMAGKPLALDAAAMKRSALPAGVRHVPLKRSAAALAVSDDGQHVAVAMFARDAGMTVLEVYRTVDGSLVHSLTRSQLRGPARGLCFLPDDSLLLITGESSHDLWRVELGGKLNRVGSTEAWGIFRDGPGKTVALVFNNRRTVAFAPANAPLKPSWTYKWGDDKCVPHIFWGAQVRFIGDTSTALLSGVHTMEPVLLDVAKKTVIRTIASSESAFADATRDGSHIVAWEKTQFNKPWLWVYRDGKAKPLAIDDENYLRRSAHVVFTPDGAHLVKLHYALQLLELKSCAPIGDPLATPTNRTGEHSPPLLARSAPLIAWTSFHHRDAEFRLHWAAFQSSCV